MKVLTALSRHAEVCALGKGTVGQQTSTPEPHLKLHITSGRMPFYAPPPPITQCNPSN